MKDLRIADSASSKLADRLIEKVPLVIIYLDRPSLKRKESDIDGSQYFIRN